MSGPAKINILREFDEFNSLNYIELPIKEQACGLRQVPRRGGRKGVAPLNKGLSRSDWGLDYMIKRMFNH